MTTVSNSKTLDEVLYAFAVTKEVPEAETLDRFVQLYPQYAEALTGLAIELALDSAQADEPCAAEAANVDSPAVMRAMSYFENYSYELNKGVPTHGMNVVSNPILSLEREDFRKLAAGLRANNTFIMKLRDRLIDPDTVVPRAGFCAAVSEQLTVPVEIVVAHLQAGPIAAVGQFYKADNKPNIVKQESFEEAVKSSGLSDEQQRYILSL
ncbi:MAG TPA: hypothetical protein VEF76_04330 [Patescibacteria group bacterium]|nr:hypothetical protein [Patescibacteria group bacterium]